MDYIKDGVYPIKDWQIRSNHPFTAFPSPLEPFHVEEMGYLPVLQTTPSYDSQTQVVTEGQPELVDGTWYKTWDISNRPADPVPEVVTMRQARLALLGAGVLTLANNAIAAMPGSEGEAARIEWEYAQEVRRDAPLVSAMASVLGLTGDQLDGLFTTATTL